MLVELFDAVRAVSTAVHHSKSCRNESCGNFPLSIANLLISVARSFCLIAVPMDTVLRRSSLAAAAGSIELLPDLEGHEAFLGRFFFASLFSAFFVVNWLIELTFRAWHGCLRVAASIGFESLDGETDVRSSTSSMFTWHQLSGRF